MEKGLFVIETGNAAGQPVVLIHGGAGGIWTWDEVVTFLPQYRCYLPEFPEHGSSQDTGPFSITDTAVRIAQWMDGNINGKKAHLVGLSVGGQVVVEMLAKFPQFISGAIISGAQVLPVPGYNLGIYSEAAMALIYWLGIYPWKKCNPWIRMNMRQSAGIPERYFPQFKKNFQELTRDGWVHVMSENYRYRLPVGLENVQVPTLIVAGPQETVEIHPSLRKLQSVLPNARGVLVGVGRGWTTPQQHNWPLTDPKLFAEMVDCWISQRMLPEGLVDFNFEASRI